MSRPFFSVIVPAYNAERHIEVGLNSIRQQEFTDYELIVVCDSCTDRTANLAKWYDAEKILIRDFHHDGLARNAGIDAAEGEWILFMDDDDWWLHEYAFRQLADMAGRHGENVLLFSFIWKNRGYTPPVPGEECVAVWNKCWRRDFIGDTRFPKAEWNADGKFHRLMWQKQPTCYYWNMPMYYYNYMRPGSQSYNVFKTMMEEKNRGQI